ncbi:uncharacterized protein LOC125777261 [Bactrocera dorsalis]|uniref:Uncharacterized protein LOC125777261 n=1 Tax=Bactrocera dorsalis TaxID=27457 RepID=A0ABM3JEA7_BACDO|nr:uncharacterized protein LOC125777261 [Bactrocera dorsalis]
MNNLNIETRNYTRHDLTKTGMLLEENRRTNAFPVSIDEDLNTRVFGNNVNIRQPIPNIENRGTNSALEDNVNITRPPTAPHFEVRPDNSAVMFENNLYTRALKDNADIVRPPTALGSSNYYYMDLLQREAEFYRRTLNELKEKDAEYYTGMSLQEDRRTNAVNLKNSTVPEENGYSRQIPTENVYPRAFEGNVDTTRPAQALESSNYYYNMKNLQREAESFRRAWNELKEKDVEYYKRMSLQEDRRTNAANLKNSAVSGENAYHRQITTENVYAQVLESSNYYYNMKISQMEAEYYKRTVMDLEEKGYRRKNAVIDCGRPNSIHPGFANIPAAYLHPNTYKNNLDLMGSPTAPITNLYNIDNLQGETAYATAFMEFGMGLMEEEHRRINYGLPYSPDSELFSRTEKLDRDIIDVCDLSVSTTEAANIEEVEPDRDSPDPPSELTSTSQASRQSMNAVIVCGPPDSPDPPSQLTSTPQASRQRMNAVIVCGPPDSPDPPSQLTSTPQASRQRMNAVIVCGPPDSPDPPSQLTSTSQASRQRMNAVIVCGPPDSPDPPSQLTSTPQASRQRMNAVIVCGPPDSPDPPSELTHSPAVPGGQPMTNSESIWGHKDIELRRETSREDLYPKSYDGPPPTSDTKEAGSEFIENNGLSTSSTESELLGYESMMTDEASSPNIEDEESLLGYETIMADEPTAQNTENKESVSELSTSSTKRTETSYHYSESSCSFHESSDSSDDDSETSYEVRSPFSPDQQFTSTPKAPRQRIIMLEPYVPTPTTSHKRIRRRHLNFSDPNLADISDDEDEIDEPAAKRPARNNGYCTD